MPSDIQVSQVSNIHAENLEFLKKVHMANCMPDSKGIKICKYCDEINNPKKFDPFRSDENAVEAEENIKQIENKKTSKRLQKIAKTNEDNIFQKCAEEEIDSSYHYTDETSLSIRTDYNRFIRRLWEEDSDMLQISEGFTYSRVKEVNVKTINDFFGKSIFTFLCNNLSIINNIPTISVNRKL
jgi:hypothetical protein